MVCIVNSTGDHHLCFYAIFNVLLAETCALLCVDYSRVQHLCLVVQPNHHRLFLSGFTSGDANMEMQTFLGPKHFPRDEEGHRSTIAHVVHLRYLYVPVVKVQTPGFFARFCHKYDLPVCLQTTFSDNDRQLYTGPVYIRLYARTDTP